MGKETGYHLRKFCFGHLKIVVSGSILKKVVSVTFGKNLTIYFVIEWLPW